MRAVHDRADGPLERVDRVGAAALDLLVGLGHRHDAGGHALRRPAGQLAAGLAHLERRDAQVAGDVVGTRRARGAAHPREVAQPGRERRVDRHRVGAGRQRVPQQPQRLVVAPLDRGVGDLEAGHLDPAGVVALDHLDGRRCPSVSATSWLHALASSRRSLPSGVDQRDRGRRR